MKEIFKSHNFWSVSIAALALAASVAPYIGNIIKGNKANLIIGNEANFGVCGLSLMVSLPIAIKNIGGNELIIPSISSVIIRDGKDSKSKKLTKLYAAMQVEGYSQQNLTVFKLLPGELFSGQVLFFRDYAKESNVNEVRLAIIGDFFDAINQSAPMYPPPPPSSGPNMPPLGAQILPLPPSSPPNVPPPGFSLKDDSNLYKSASEFFNKEFEESPLSTGAGQYKIIFYAKTDGNELLDVKAYDVFISETALKRILSCKERLKYGEGVTYGGGLNGRAVIVPLKEINEKESRILYDSVIGGL